MNDRTKLAVAMGWDRIYVGRLTEKIYGHLQGAIGATQIPDPENDANDDYAVLKWINAGNLPWGSAEHITYSEWENDFCPWFKENERENPWEYKIGDYARAALKALG